MLGQNQLRITDENGELITINVLDILDRRVSLFKKRTLIIYTVEGEPDKIYASILNEKKTSFSLDTITDPADIEFVKKEIERFANSPDD